jgi:hypothetical protein
VAAKAGSGIEGHKAERLRRRRIDDFPDVDAESPAHEGELVHQADVDGAERVLQELHHLGRLGR